jgi:hypothetical protein
MRTHARQVPGRLGPARALTDGSGTATTSTTRGRLIDYRVLFGAAT